MKLQAVTLLAAAATASAHSNYPACKSQGYAHDLSKHEAKQCYQSIAEKGLRIATCQPPARTYTSTRSVRPQVIVTKTVKPCPRTAKVTTTITKTGDPVIPPTTTLTATSTAIVSTTSTETSTSTVFNTVTATDVTSLTLSATATLTVTSTSTIPFVVVTTCAAPVKRGFILDRRSNKRLPASCSVLLTSTARAPVKTATVTRTLPAFTWIRYTVGKPTTTTRTITVTQYASGTTLAAPEVTVTITTSITQTERATSTSTDVQSTTEHVTSTSTLTETSTVMSAATATATANPCDNINVIKVSGSRSLTSPNAVLGVRTNGGAQTCCITCYMNADCVFFRSDNQVCEIFFTRNNVVYPCTSSTCRRGRTPLIVGTSDGKDYYLGGCVGPQIA